MVYVTFQEQLRAKIKYFLQAVSRYTSWLQNSFDKKINKLTTSIPKLGNITDATPLPTGDLNENQQFQLYQRKLFVRVHIEVSVL